jgi:hypothetical protein
LVAALADLIAAGYVAHLERCRLSHLGNLLYDIYRLTPKGQRLVAAENIAAVSP